MIQRGGAVVLQMLDNVQQVTIKPLIQRTVGLGSQIYTDEYGIYNALSSVKIHSPPSQGDKFQVFLSLSGVMRLHTMRLSKTS